MTTKLNNRYPAPIVSCPPIVGGGVGGVSEVGGEDEDI